MRPYVEREGIVDPKKLGVPLEHIREWLDQLPEAPKSILDGNWSCHALTRAVLSLFGLKENEWVVADGYFRFQYQHSWLERATNDSRERAVLDVYPVGVIGGPLLLDGNPFWGPWAECYDQKPNATWVTEKQRLWNEHADAAIAASDIRFF